jgi:hypothetical protein
MGHVKFILFITLLNVLISCHSEKTPEDKKDIVLNDILAAEADTFSIGNQLFLMEKITKEDFDKIPEPSITDTSESNLIRNSQGVVSRKDSSLILIIGNKTLAFKDNTGAETEEYCKFTYAGFWPDINQHIIYGIYIESFNYLLIDAETADTNFSCSLPIMSPDKNFFICGNVDLIARFVMNGFDLYNVKDKKIRLVGRREQEEWGPEKIKWADNKTLFVERAVLDTTTADMIRKDYVKLILK